MTKIDVSSRKKIDIFFFSCQLRYTVGTLRYIFRDEKSKTIELRSCVYLESFYTKKEKEKEREKECERKREIERERVSERNSVVK